MTAEAEHRLELEEKLQALRARRDSVGRKLRSELDQGKKEKLFREWDGLFKQIIEMRKELGNDNDGRLSG